MFCMNHTLVGAVVMFQGDTCPICNLITENYQHAERLSLRPITNFLENSEAAKSLDIETPEALEEALQELDKFKDVTDGNTPDELKDRLESLESWEQLGDFDEIEKNLNNFDELKDAVSEAFDTLRRAKQDM